VKASREFAATCVGLWYASTVRAVRLRVATAHCHPGTALRSSIWVRSTLYSKRSILRNQPLETQCWILLFGAQCLGGYSCIGNWLGLRWLRTSLVSF
jgi:hypothetical protein